MSKRPTLHRVLLVEDNAGDALLACERLSDAPDSSLKVHQVATLADASKHLAEGRIDVVVLDLNLPDSRGIHTLHEVKRIAPSIPVIVVSGAFDASLHEIVVAEGAADMFGKDETNSRLFVRSVLYVLEREKASVRHRQLEQLLDALPDAIVVTDSGGTVRFANPAAARLFGRPRDELLEEPALFATSQDAPSEITILASGQTRDCEMRVVSIEWEGEPAQLASIRDLTARNQAEQLRLRSAVLERDNERIESANRAKSQFLANMSHEIRTPLNAVIGLSYLLERTELNCDQADLVGKVNLAGKSLLGIVNNVLDLSKIEAAELHLEHAPFELKRLLDELEQLASLQADAKGIGFAIDAPADLPPYVGDATRLQQVLTNLVNNAIKFTERGQVMLSVCEQSGPQGAAHLHFAVRDSGIGIAPEVLQRLFQPFTQADSSTTRRFGGTGLGLSIVKQLVDLMGGQAGACSTPGKGSEFWVELPLARGEPGALSISGFMPAQIKNEACGLPGVRVLVVDDSPINREVARRILELHGAQVSLAENGQDAVNRLLDAPQDFDVVLMDVQMPVLDGLDATRRIRSGLGLRRLPIIALAAGALGTERRQAETAGMNDFVVKPFEPEALVCSIRRQVLMSGREAQPHEPPSAAGAVPWPLIEGIDTEAVRRRLRGDLALFTSMLRRLLREFAELHPGAVRTAQEFKACEARLHNLRGSAGTLGAVALERLAAQAEQQARTGKAAQLAESLANLSRQLAELGQRARPLLDHARDEEHALLSKSAAPPLDTQALQQLIQLLRSSNMAAEKRFWALAPALRERLGPRAFDGLRQRIEELRYDDAASELLSITGGCVGMAMSR